MELTLKEKQKAVNFWQNDPNKKTFRTYPKARKMIPMIVNFELRLLCPDTGTYTTNIPKTVYHYYKKFN